MENQEAIKSMHNLDELISITESEHESVRMAIVALEKQIPKKPIGSMNVIGVYCPGCKKVWVNSNYDYCHRCGQAIDWEV